MNPNNKWKERRNLCGVEEFLLRQREVGAAYCERRPALDLTAVVACLWVRVVRRTGREPLIPVIPDGCADIITWVMATIDLMPHAA
jgi:hypothetical protein